MAAKHSPKQLSKLIAYVLGKAPAEFGLVPAEDGFFKVKDLLKALWEEDGLRHVRESHLNEILLTVPDAPFEIRDRMIRSINREGLPGIRQAENLPKLLYACVRRKAHGFALEKGIFPVGHDRVVLAADPEMAVRIGRRFDASPVMMTVQTAKCREFGVSFFEAGTGLFLADSIPTQCFAGPPLPKEKIVENKPQKIKDAEAPEERTPGSYFVDFSPKKQRKKKEYLKREKDIAWKKERKRKRKTGDKW